MAPTFELLSKFAASCTNTTSFLGFPTWYAYLPAQTDVHGRCVPALTSLSDVWLIVAALIEILLRIAAIAAISMLVFGGFRFVTSSGSADQANKAQQTIINALIGLVIAVGAATIIQFIAGRFTG